MIKGDPGVIEGNSRGEVSAVASAASRRDDTELRSLEEQKVSASKLCGILAVPLDSLEDIS